VRFVDSHLHLDPPAVEETVRFAAHAGALLFACGVDEGTSGAAARLADAYPLVVKAFVGVHPSEASEAGDLAWLRKAARTASGVGEIGLDPSYSSVEEGSAQMNAFRLQIEVAEDEGRPVQIHSRMAEARCIEVLSTSRVRRVLMHWLESEEALPLATDRGYFVSFGPALIYSKKLQRIAAKADPSLVLLESDSPVPYAPLGGVSGPMLVPSVAYKLAQIRGEGFSETLATCNENALRFLG
jgi:TatD DNase family protein